MNFSLQYSVPVDLSSKITSSVLSHHNHRQFVCSLLSFVCQISTQSHYIIYKNKNDEEKVTKMGEKMKRNTKLKENKKEQTSKLENRERREYERKIPNQKEKETI